MNNYPDQTIPAQNNTPQSQSQPELFDAPPTTPVGHNFSQRAPTEPLPQPAGYRPARKRRRPWIAVVVILLLLVIGGGVFYYVQIRSTPQKTLQAYCDAVTANDSLALYNTYSSAVQARVSEQQLDQALQVIEFTTGGFTSCTVENSNIQETGSVAVGKIDFTTKRGKTYSDTIDLVNENGQWKVQHNASLI